MGCRRIFSLSRRRTWCSDVVISAQFLNLRVLNTIWRTVALLPLLTTKLATLVPTFPTLDHVTPFLDALGAIPASSHHPLCDLIGIVGRRGIRKSLEIIRHREVCLTYESFWNQMSLRVALCARPEFTAGTLTSPIILGLGVTG